MPRKLKRPLPPAADGMPPKPQPAMTLEGEPAPPVVERPKIGRPSKADVEARQQAERRAAEVTPEQMQPVTLLLVSFICKAAKGDTPTTEEIALVNPPLTAVANKYSLSNRWAPELALLGSVFLVLQASRERARGKQETRVEPAPDRASLAGAIDAQFEAVM